MLCYRQHILAVILGWTLLPTQCLSIPSSPNPHNLIQRQGTRAPDPIDQASFDTILHVAQYAGTYGTAPCKKPPQGATVVAFAQNDTTETQQTLFRHDGDKEVVLAFPGTINLQDIGTDLNFPQMTHPACDGCAVHQGVYTGWLSVADETMKQVKDAMQSTPDFKFIIAGHSLGGGLANLAYVDIQRAGIKVDRVVTFGELAVGNQKYADHVDAIAGATDEPSQPGIFMRVTHANDGVPLLPPMRLRASWERTSSNTAPSTGHRVTRTYLRPSGVMDRDLRRAIRDSVGSESTPRMCSILVSMSSPVVFRPRSHYTNDENSVCESYREEFAYGGWR
ncbi:feruloyl esterase A [Apiospora arundinis]